MWWKTPPLASPPSSQTLTLPTNHLSKQFPLLKCTDPADIEFFMRHKNPIQIGKVVKKAYKLARSTPESVDPTRKLGLMRPLTSGQYPVFNQYPAYIVDFQVQERERIRQEELDFLRQRTLAIETARQTEQLRLEERAWNRQQQLLLDAEEERRQRYGRGGGAIWTGF